MTSTDFLVKKVDKQRIPYEERGKEYDKQRKREERQRELRYLVDDLINECEKHKRLRLNPHQKERVKYMVKLFANNFKTLHGQADSETIILAFIFYIKLNEEPRLKLNEYKITSEYGLTDNIFEIIVCRLCEYHMKRTPLPPVETTDYDHEILCRNGGKK